MAASEDIPRLVVAVTGATGTTYAWHLLQQLKKSGQAEVHLIMSSAGVLTAQQEMGLERADFEQLADYNYSNKDIGAALASGSFLVEGMVIIPCSMKTLASVANGLSDNLISRAADVMLKQRRRLVLLTRETPLNLVHLRNMTALTEAGGVIFPPVPAFYAGLETLDDMVAHTVGRVLDLFGFQHQGLVTRWQGLAADKKKNE